MWQFLLPSNWSKKYSLAGVVTALSFMMAERGAVCWHEAVVDGICIASTCFLAACYIKHQAKIDANGK